MDSHAHMLELCHAIPGRSRFRIGAIRRNAEQAERVERWLTDLAAVGSVAANPLTGSVVVAYDAAAMTGDELERALRDGLEVLFPDVPGGRRRTPAGDEDTVGSALWNFVKLTAVTGTVVVREVVFKQPVAQSLTSPLGIFTVAASLPLLSRSYAQLRAGGRLSLDTFLGVTTVAAVAVGEATTALEVLWIESGASWLTAWIAERSRNAITEMMQLTERAAYQVVDGTEVEVPVEGLAAGDLVAVHADERIAVDGRIEAGEAMIDESPITGRAEVVVRRREEEVFAGTVVRAGVIHVRAVEVGGSTYLARIFQMVEDSLENKAPIEGVADRLARSLVTLGFVATAGALVVTGSPWNAFMVMLVMACPCATTLAASTAVSAAISRAARRHVLIKGGRYLEEIGKVEVVCFDKTGTLTTGRAAVKRIVAIDGRSERELLELAVTAEGRSHHPLAVALHAEARARGLAPAPVHDAEMFLGMGVRAVHAGRELMLGNRKFMHRRGVAVPQTDGGHGDGSVRRIDHTVIFLAQDGELIGMFELAQELRPDAHAVVTELREQGVNRVILVTGDEEPVAQTLARDLGIDAYCASVVPEAKATIVTDLKREGRVAMVGDGINDALALAEADVGVAMGAGGSPVAIEAADIALVRDDLQDVLFARQLSHDTLGIVHQNFWIATSSNIMGVVLGLTGQLTPMMAGLLHVVHSVGVLLNSSRLLGYEPHRVGDATAADPRSYGTRSLPDAR